MNKLRVLVGFGLAPRYVDGLRSGFPNVEFRVSRNKAEMLEMVSDVEVFFGWPTDAVVEAGRVLRWLHLLGAGVDGFSPGPVIARDIAVTNSRGVAASNIAEHVLALMLGFARALPVLARAQGEQRWMRSQDLRLFELSGQTVGIIGLGAIGQQLAVKAGALGMHVLGARRNAEATPGVEKVYRTDELPALAAECDHLVACLPGTPETAGMINAAVFDAMKPGSYFYNVGRGLTVVTADLVRALDAGRVAGAGLDVIDIEPLPSGHPLWTHPAVVVTAHTAGNTEQYWERGIVLFEQNLRRFMGGTVLLNRVDLAKGY